MHGKWEELGREEIREVVSRPGGGGGEGVSKRGRVCRT